MSAPAAGTAIRTKSPHPSKFERAIVVGASSGMGAELAKQLAAEGAHVALVGRRESELEAVAATIRAAGGRAIVAKHDVTAYEDVPRVYEALTKELGGLDLIAYCSGAINCFECADRRAISVCRVTINKLPKHPNACAKRIVFRHL